MKKKLLTLSIIGALSATSCAVIADDHKGDNVDASEKSGMSAAAQTLDLSAQLEALGRDQQDALLLAAALRLQQAAKVEMAERKKDNQDEGKADADKAAKADLAALARQYAGENEALQAVVAMATDSSASRGRVGGSVDGHVDRVRAEATDVYKIDFRGGRDAEVYVRGDGDTDLDLFITDENGNDICSDTETDDRPYCSWSPRWTGEFTVRIENLGDVYNEYELYTN